MSTLDKAIQVAVKAHAGQRRRGGTPYIFHPLRMMLRQTSEDAMIVAVLHDVVEDTSVTLARLKRMGFSERVLEALYLLTRKDSIGYDTYIQAIAGNALARQVKLTDLEDNMNLLELPAVSDKELARAAKYHAARETLMRAEGVVKMRAER